MERSRLVHRRTGTRKSEVAGVGDNGHALFRTKRPGSPGCRITESTFMPLPIRCYVRVWQCICEGGMQINRHIATSSPIGGAVELTRGHGLHH